MRYYILLVLFILVLTPVSAQEYEFEIPEEEESKIEFNGNLDVKWAILNTREASPFYEIQFYQTPENSSYLSRYRLDYYFNGEYRRKKVGFVMNTFSQYKKDEPVSLSFYELYGSLNLSPKLTFGIGKKRFIWGKGYAFNPSGYVNFEKDPENPELALSGKSSAFFMFNKSLNSTFIKNFSFSSIILPPESIINEKFAPLEDTEIALKMYFLAENTDIDFMFFYGKNQLRRYGFDFSTNLKENFEIHGEWSYAQNEGKVIIQKNLPLLQKIDGSSFLFGIRYLNRFNTTVIAEYYHNNRGLSKKEFNDYYDYIDSSLKSGGFDIISQVKQDVSWRFVSKTLMKDYLYFSIRQPEPFGWLYSSVSIFTIYNLNDNSFILSPRFGYEPFTN
ncbi:hypothetical protein ACFL4Z_03750, partial [candidate division KSB1 bacterium]